ncbi:hypothetical protein [Mycobacteroides abscessus]|uniref:hypothetical protein n=1 Tax=Mycobacteroides abscessus TaxID=36809 RepID=UPI001878054A
MTIGSLLPNYPGSTPRIAVPSRGQWVSAWISFVVAAIAAVVAIVAFSHPVDPRRRSVAMAPAAQPTYSPSEVAVAQKKACTAWDSAAVAMTSASNAVADTPTGWDNPARQRARQIEAWAMLTQTAYLRSRTDPASPPELAGLLSEYNRLTLAIQDAAVHRDGKAIDALIDQQNLITEKLEVLCNK